MMVHNNKWDPNIAKTIGLTPEAVENLGSLLDSLHESIDGSFNHINQKKHSCLYLTGLLSDIPRKNLESIALEFGDVKTVRTLQHFFQKGKWDENYMHQVYLQEVSPYIADSNGMLMVDGCGFTKKGTESVGVARQYNGSEGKVSNCQVGVFWVIPQIKDMLYWIHSYICLKSGSIQSMMNKEKNVRSPMILNF